MLRRSRTAMCCGRERISSSENVAHTSTTNLCGPLIEEAFIEGADIEHATGCPGAKRHERANEWLLHWMPIAQLRANDGGARKMAIVRLWKTRPQLASVIYR